MKIKKLIILKSAVFFSAIVLVTVPITGCQKNIKNDQNSDNYISNEITETSNNQEKTIENNEEKVTNSKNNKENDTILHNEETKSVNQEENIISNDDKIDSAKQPEQYTEDDKTVINTFNNIENEVDNLLQSEATESTKDKLKGTFITVVDFIFYDAEINGIKFDDLTEGAKQNILETANNIDSKIDKKFPGYKETISDKTKNAYNKASEVIKKGATNIKNFSKEKLGEESYNAIIDAKDELVYYTKNAFNIIGNITSNVWEKGKSKVKDWYEKFRNN